ncbi:YfhO family protein [Paludisphaera rhizosphaerae]|uniref:YfhO family protein n=1 Tax=Paludisphaera rhizosphaerae TaxID=2711216 RepID=UPI0013EDB1DF|nr:YfhO family protein [Paludisphaera rhizosphaerae]
MPSRRAELIVFGVVLATLVGGFLHDALRPGRILSPADVLLVESSFREPGSLPFEPANRLLMDPVLQFQPWLAFNRSEIRAGRLPLWNPYAGCGAPHLANAQSAVFDPFNLIIVLGPWPTALAWTAAARLWFAGLGAFLLARSWGFGPWGRWFVGLTFPFCGFLVVWLLYPVTPAAVWLPWVLLASDRAIASPSARSAGLLALCVGGVLVAGHIQTSAHVLLASLVLAIWRLAVVHERRAPALSWGMGVALGIGIAAVQIVPLADYLGKSPVWAERHREHPPWWRPTRPRILEAACTALPYLYGSQRQGHPNLARGLGLNNLNESAGGFAGLATFAWLAPLAVIGARKKSETRLLIVLLTIGAMGAFRIPPVDNLLRALPVVGVMDNRRLTLWVAFALTFLGGIGLDRTASGELLSQRWSNAWTAVGCLFFAGALLIPFSESALRQRAERHYQNATEPLEPPEIARRVELQVRTTLDFSRRYLGIAAAAFGAMLTIAEGARGGITLLRSLPALLLAATLVDLFAFGVGLNPAIDREVQEFEPLLIKRLREDLRPGRRALGLGGELPSNVLMRFGLADPRNYDSVEMARNLDYFEPLYEETDEARSSRRTVSWRTVARALPKLREAAVGAIVAASPPPDPSLFNRVEKIGAAWVAWLDGPERVTLEGPGRATVDPRSTASAIRVDVSADGPARLILRETWDEGWTARVDGKPVDVDCHDNVFMSLSIMPNPHVVEFAYQPGPVRISLATSIGAVAAAVLALTVRRRWAFMEWPGGGLDGTEPAG